MKRNTILASEVVWFTLFLFSVLHLNLSAEEEGAGERPAAKTVEEQRLDTLRYGMEAEIASLIKTLQAEGAFYLDEDLLVLAEDTRNQSILTALFSFFGDRRKEELKERALRVIAEREDEATETVLGAVEYLGKLTAGEAVEPLEGLLNETDRRFMNTAFRALGQIGGGNQDAADSVAEYLIDYYNNRNVDADNQREIIIALGEANSPAAVPLLSEIAGNTDERASARISAMEALSKIGDPGGLAAVLDGVSSRDPNIRSAAVSALGPFTDPAVDRAILEAFRDAYYRTRIAAAKASGVRKLEPAIPYLNYRAERDDVPAVKDEAIRALGAIATNEAQAVLEALFLERKNADRVRLLSGEMLIKNNPGAYASRVIIELDEAKRTNQTALYNGLLRVIGAAKTPAVEDLARRFFAAGGVTEKSYALDMTENNNFTGLKEQVRELSAENNGNLSRKAKAVLEKLESAGDSPN
jgi:HEAT repeat protein